MAPRVKDSAVGELIDLTARRTQRDRHIPDPTPTFFFDVSDPLSYLMAEQVERSLGEVQWVAVDGTALGDRDTEQAPLRKHAEARAEALRLPLVWPETFPAGTPCALRAASYACEIGAGAQFALAASRLAFCGGFDLEDPEALTEAAAAAGVPLEGCMNAVSEHWRDEELAEMANVLRVHEIFEVPAVTIGGRWFAGDAALQRAGAISMREPHRARAPRAEPGRYRRPLAPVG
jgi:2-hydroxychromene-2-carboxylate isomerase